MSWNQSLLRGEGRGDDDEVEWDGMDTKCADDDDCCAAVPLAGPIDLPGPTLPTVSTRVCMYYTQYLTVLHMR